MVGSTEMRSPVSVVVCSACTYVDRNVFANWSKSESSRSCELLYGVVGVGANVSPFDRSFRSASVSGASRLWIVRVVVVRPWDKKGCCLVTFLALGCGFDVLRFFPGFGW